MQSENRHRNYTSSVERRPGRLLRHRPEVAQRRLRSWIFKSSLRHQRWFTKRSPVSFADLWRWNACNITKQVCPSTITRWLLDIWHRFRLRIGPRLVRRQQTLQTDQVGAQTVGQQGRQRALHGRRDNQVWCGAVWPGLRQKHNRFQESLMSTKEVFLAQFLCHFYFFI